MTKLRLWIANEAHDSGASITLDNVYVSQYATDVYTGVDISGANADALRKFMGVEAIPSLKDNLKGARNRAELLEAKLGQAHRDYESLQADFLALSKKERDQRAELERVNKRRDELARETMSQSRQIGELLRAGPFREETLQDALSASVGTSVRLEKERNEATARASKLLADTASLEESRQYWIGLAKAYAADLKNEAAETAKLRDRLAQVKVAVRDV